MQTEKFILNEERNVTLTSYIQDISPEMKHLDKRPAVLVLPGGGYFMCSDREAEPVALAYLAEGYNAFVLRYSILEHSTFPNPLDDACKAISFIRENAEKFNILPDKVAAIGFSAGGHLCAYLSNTEGYRPNASILCYPSILDTMSEKLYNHEPTNVNELVTRDTPPTFVFSTCKDNLVPIMNSTKYIEALAENDVPFEAHIFENGQHGLSLAKNATGYVETIAAQWVRLSLDWLNNEFDFNGD